MKKEKILADFFNKGEIIKDQYDLFPLRHNDYSTIQPLIDNFRGQLGDFTMAIGTYSRPVDKNDSHYNSFVATSYDWILLASFPRSFSELFRYRFYGNRLEIANQEELEELGVLSFPKIRQKFHNAYCVYLENMLIAELESQSENQPEALGWWHSDSGGFGSLIFDPFLFKKEEFQKLGYMAIDVFDQMPYVVDNPLAKENYVEWHFSKKYLEEYFEKYKLAGKIVTHAEGNYPGRSGCNSWNTGLQKKTTTVLHSAEDFRNFGYKGCRILKIE